MTCGAGGGSTNAVAVLALNGSLHSLGPVSLYARTYTTYDVSGRRSRTSQPFSFEELHSCRGVRVVVSLQATCSSYCTSLPPLDSTGCQPTRSHRSPVACTARCVGTSGGADSVQKRTGALHGPAPTALTARTRKRHWLPGGRPVALPSTRAPRLSPPSLACEAADVRECVAEGGCAMLNTRGGAIAPCGSTCSSWCINGRPLSAGAIHSKCILRPSRRTSAGGSGADGTYGSVSTTSGSDQPHPPISPEPSARRRKE
mmetsp:Transcript_14285/g.35637  ORF Transcript_14285/g.35637 Transcript_14285/m.35637 type:complete len:258 (-) Transcript_14285:174-947(-)